MRFFAPALIFCGVVASSAQTPIVPHKMHFAGMTLVVRDDARREIQNDVDALTQSPRYFNIKAERAKTYFPIIERIFAEERVPDDFKFLVLQESALIADAVSVSDAVGFWQFKDYTAREMGMRVDENVDERMNIVAATRGAAKFIKQNNFMFNNWLYALQAYQMGAGGLKRIVGDDLDGSRHMEINSETYWYVKKFLAHKVAFAAAVKGDPQIKITEHVLTQGGSLQAIAGSVSLEISGLREFNKWVRKDGIPSDKPYTIILPMGNHDLDFSKLVVSSPTSSAQPATTALPTTGSIPAGEALVNDIPVILAQQGESLATLAQRAEIALPPFLRFNEVTSDHQVIPGTYYFLGKKKSSTYQDYHKVGSGENLWQVSQRFGIQVKRLRKLNHMNNDARLNDGTILWLNSNKPREGVLDDTDPVVELEEDEVFDWPKANDIESYPAAKDEQQSYLESPAKPASTDGTHLVHEGETLYAIAKNYGLSVNDLKLVNGLADPLTIKPGQILKVTVDEHVNIEKRLLGYGQNPPDLPAASAEVIHEIRASDTIYSVARQYGVTIKDLMDCNDKKDFAVSLGEKLKIPSR